MRPAVLLVLAAAALAAPPAIERAALGDGMPSPLDQRRAGAQPGDVECREGLVAALRSTHGAACVRPETARALGWQVVQERLPKPPGLSPPLPPESLVFGALFLDAPVMNGYMGCYSGINPATFYYGSQTGQWVRACAYEAYGYRHYLLDLLGVGFCGDALIGPYENPHTKEEVWLPSTCDGFVVNPSVPGPGLPDPVNSVNGQGSARFLADSDQSGAPLRARAWLAADGIRSGEPAAQFDADKYLDRYAAIPRLTVYDYDSVPRSMLFGAPGSYSPLPEFLPLDDAIAIRAHKFSKDRTSILVVADPRLLSHDPAASHATVNGTLVPLAVSHADAHSVNYILGSGFYADAPHPAFVVAFTVSDVARDNGVLISGITDGEGGGLPVVDLEDVVLEIGLPVAAVNKAGYG